MKLLKFRLSMEGVGDMPKRRAGVSCLSWVNAAGWDGGGVSVEGGGRRK